MVTIACKGRWHTGLAGQRHSRRTLPCFTIALHRYSLAIVVPLTLSPSCGCLTIREILLRASRRSEIYRPSLPISFLAPTIFSSLFRNFLFPNCISITSLYLFPNLFLFIAFISKCNNNTISWSYGSEISKYISNVGYVIRFINIIYVYVCVFVCEDVYVRL